MKALIILWSIVIILGIFTYQTVFAEPEGCQYLGRPTNTETTCDNTDPADPTETYDTETEYEPVKPKVIKSRSLK